jgi:hypothetical protein
MDPEEKMGNFREKKVFLLARALVSVVQRKLLVLEIAVSCGHRHGSEPDSCGILRFVTKAKAKPNSVRAIDCLYSW